MERTFDELPPASHFNYTEWPGRGQKYLVRVREPPPLKNHHTNRGYQALFPAESRESAMISHIFHTFRIRDSLDIDPERSHAGLKGVGVRKLI